MQSQVNYALVGLFVMALGAALLGVSFWLTLGGETNTYDPYRVYFQESVAGWSWRHPGVFVPLTKGDVALTKIKCEGRRCTFRMVAGMPATGPRHAEGRRRIARRLPPRPGPPRCTAGRDATG